MGSFSISTSCIILFSAAFGSAAFQFSFGQPSRNGNEATDGAPSSTLDIAVPVEITISPSEAILSADTFVIVSVSGGSATRMSISF